ncbi:ABC transporter ATP-binding protein [Rhizobium halophytocola]|uniref:NitT/TauT family transport system ATP-binding protein n=1 Tax=Rhizobium halophytocola TaxID=735519 RepID=A0ABS4DU51_9HYPH|nr:ABC transporter ATP-binding protein [Rhizobium halophytocola]MBP1849200.1 NitT/TauT family transport system ATP-binding protein [Rhizobium halophytocola]
MAPQEKRYPSLVEAPGPAPLIELEKVSVHFASQDGARVTALQSLNLQIRSGEIMSLVGPSGCGKSTTLRLIAGLQQPSEGMLTIHGGAKRKGFSEVAIVFQRPTLLPWLDVLSNVLYPARVLSRRLGAEQKARAMDLLDLVGLADAASKRPRELSGGMQQRVAICRSLILDPKILLMDEPFGALDALTREDLQLDLLRIHAETGKTILLVTHSISEAVLLSDRVAVMSARPGRLQELHVIDIAKPRSHHTPSDPKFVSHAQQIRDEIFEPRKEN